MITPHARRPLPPPRRVHPMGWVLLLLILLAATWFIPGHTGSLFGGASGLAGVETSATIHFADSGSATGVSSGPLALSPLAD